MLYYIAHEVIKMRYAELVNILLSEKPSEELRKRKEELVLLIPEFGNCIGFDQKSIYHPYDVFEHTLRVIDGVEDNFCLRLAALFHDVGKPYIKDPRGEGHFGGHWNKSKDIFIKYKDNFFISFSSFTLICNLIEYHDFSVDIKNVKTFISKFSEDEMKLLFSLKKSDIYAQNKDFIKNEMEKLDIQQKIYNTALENSKDSQIVKRKGDY